MLIYENRSKNVPSLDLQIYTSLSRIQWSLLIMIHWTRRMPEDHSKKRIDSDPYAWVLFVFAAAAAHHLDVQFEHMCCDQGGLCVSVNSVFNVIPPEPDIPEGKKCANCQLPYETIIVGQTRFRAWSNCFIAAYVHNCRKSALKISRTKTLWNRNGIL